MKGSGIYTDPYLIGSQSDLEAIGDSPAAVYELVSDISLSGNLTPLPAFSGWLNGKGYKITNLTVAVSSGFYGLFERIVDGGRVTDLEIVTSDTGVSSSNTDQPGGVLAGLFNFDGEGAAPIIERVIARGKVSSGKGAGGLVGFIYNRTGLGNNIPSIRQCGVFVQVDLSNGQDGGILASNASGGVDTEDLVVSPEIAGLSVLAAINNTNVYGTPTELTTAEIGDPNLYPVYWDFDHIWEIKDGYPRLQRALEQTSNKISKVSGVVQINGTPATRTVRAFGYDPAVHTINQKTVSLSKSLGHSISSADTGEYTIDLLEGYGDRIFVVAFDDYGADFTSEMTVNVGDRVHPTTPNGYVWECTGAGTLPAEEPTWVVDEDTAQLYGTASMIARPFYRPMVHGPVAPEVTLTGWSFASVFDGTRQGFWFKVSDTSTLFTDEAGSSPVTTDGQTVALMLDKSGNNLHARQSDPLRRPTYRTDGTNHWLEFTGGQWLDTDTISQGPLWSVYALAWFNDGASSPNSVVDSDGALRMAQYLRGKESTLESITWPGPVTTPAPGSWAANEMLVLEAHRDDTTFEVGLDAQVTAPVSVSGGVSGFQFVRIGARVNSNSQPLNGRIYEVALTTNTILSAQERESADIYLMTAAGKYTPPPTALYVRFWISAPQDATKEPMLTEVWLEDPDGNLILTKTEVVAASSYYTASGSYQPEKIIDGDPLSLTATDQTDVYNRWVANGKTDEWISIALGEPKTIKAIHVLGTAYASTTNKGRCPLDWRIEVSDDNTNWTTVYENVNEPAWGDQEIRVIDLAPL